MEKAKIKASTVGKIFNFLKKEKGEEVPSKMKVIMKYLTADLSIEIAKENLSITKFNNGDPIPEAKTKKRWVELGVEKVPAFMRYGKHLHYNHFAVMDERGICPSGWRVPTEEDLLFIKYKKLYKTFPFAGYRRYSNGVAFNAGSAGRYWSSTAGGSGARGLFLSSGDNNVYGFNRANGLSIRCVRDKE